MGYYEFVATYTNMETCTDTTELISVDFSGLSPEDLGTNNAETAAWRVAMETAYDMNTSPESFLSKIEFLSAS